MGTIPKVRNTIRGKKNVRKCHVNSLARYSAIGKHLETQHDNSRTKSDHLFKVLRKFNSKFDCLGPVYMEWGTPV